MDNKIIQLNKELDEVKELKDLEKYGIKIGKSYISFNYGIHKVKIYHKNKSIYFICSMLNYDYGFLILTVGMNIYYNNITNIFSPKVNKDSFNQMVAIYEGNGKYLMIV